MCTSVFIQKDMNFLACYLFILGIGTHSYDMYIFMNEDFKIFPLCNPVYECF